MRRSLVIAAGWVGAGAAAAVFGVATISALGDGTGSSRPLSRQEVSERLAQAPAAPGPTGSGAAGPTPSTVATSTALRKYFTTSGGSVWASCAAGQARLETLTPRQGFRLDGYDKGPAPAAWVRFKLDVRHGHGDEFQVTVTCANGVPQMTETADT